MPFRGCLSVRRLCRILPSMIAWELGLVRNRWCGLDSDSYIEVGVGIGVGVCGPVFGECGRHRRHILTLVQLGSRGVYERRWH